MKKWLTDIKNYAPDEDQLSILLVGNKSDLNEKRQVQKDDPKLLGNYEYTEASAMTGEGVNPAFDLVIESMKRKREATL